ncbi:MAG TPA: ester cyclase [Micromonosporaceae bacterium]
MSLETNKQVVVDFFQAINERRYDDWSKYMAADVIDHNKIIVDEEDAPGAAFDGFRQQLTAFGEGGMFPQQLIAEGDTVVARLLVRATHTGFHPRMPQPTGRSCEVEQIWIATIRDGKIAELRAVSDRLGMFIPLGWEWPAL